MQCCSSSCANRKSLARFSRTVFLHDRQEFDDDLGAGSDHDLTLAGFLGIVDALERVIEDRGLDHGGGGWWESSRFPSP